MEVPISALQAEGRTFRVLGRSVKHSELVYVVSAVLPEFSAFEQCTLIMIYEQG